MNAGLDKIIESTVQIFVVAFKNCMGIPPTWIVQALPTVIMKLILLSKHQNQCKPVET